jgi:hypothetical protein
MDDVSCGKPGVSLSHSIYRQWAPYVTISSPPTVPLMTDHVEEVCQQRVLLCEIMAPLGQNL